MVYLTFRNLEGALAMKFKYNERGQSILLFAILIPLMSLFLLGILDYMVTNARVMEAVAIADLAAHAGAQEITVLPNGTITATTAGNGIAATYFNAQRPGYVQLVSASCGRHQGRPACFVTAHVRSAGYLLPARWITVRAIGYLAHGVTHGDQ
jgi:Flp pilus assembly protein TadG